MPRRGARPGRQRGQAAARRRRARPTRSRCSSSWWTSSCCTRTARTRASRGRRRSRGGVHDRRPGALHRRLGAERLDAARPRARRGAGIRLGRRAALRVAGRARARTSCADAACTFDECPFWTAVGQEAFGGWDKVDTDEMLRARGAPSCATARSRCWRWAGSRPSHAQAVRRYADLTAQLYRGILTVSGAQVVVDSTKNPPYAYFLRAAAGSRRRAARRCTSCATAAGWCTRGRSGSRAPRWPRGEAYFQEFSPVSAGVRWMQCNLAFELLRRLGAPTVRMRYESLAADPRGELERMFAAMGEPGRHDLSAIGADSVQVAGQHSVRGNPMRFAHGRQQVRARRGLAHRHGPEDALARGAGDLAAAAPLRLSPPGTPRRHASGSRRAHQPQPADRLGAAAGLAGLRDLRPPAGVVADRALGGHVGADRDPAARDARHPRGPAGAAPVRDLAAPAALDRRPPGWS